jgi:prevent-host-death family protein
MADVAMVATSLVKASIRDLKNRTSELLRRVRAGEHLVVTDRGRPIAELAPIRPAQLQPEDRLARLAARGDILLPRGRGLDPVVPVRRRRGRPVADTLLADRD